MIQRAVGLWAVRRAYRLLLADDGRPLRTRLVGEAKRIVIAAAIIAVLLIAAFIAAIVAVIWVLA